MMIWGGRGEWTELGDRFLVGIKVDGMLDEVDGLGDMSVCGYGWE